MARLNEKMSANLPRMEALVRISNIPIVESSTKTAGKIYNDLKQKSGLLNWGFGTAESMLGSVLESVRPAVRIVEGPLQRFDQLLCGGLDAVEHRVPSIYLPPQTIYSNTKDYMSDILIRPVLKRADSIKHIGSSVLDNRVSTYAADRIEKVIDVADVYVEKYLPSEDQVDSGQSDDDNQNKAIHTFHRSQRFSRKLKRRLTQRTIAEARALKKQGKEAIHVLIYAAELIATDPKLAYQKAHELWADLSKDEPENQHRPQTIEELLVLLTRESARRMVHLVNYGGVIAKGVPNTVCDMLHQLTYVSSSMTRFAYLDRLKLSISGDFYGSISRISELTGLLQFCSTEALERLAHILVGRSTNNTAQQCNAGKKTRKHRHVNHTDGNAKRENHENGI